MFVEGKGLKCVFETVPVRKVAVVWIWWRNELAFHKLTAGEFLRLIMESIDQFGITNWSVSLYRLQFPLTHSVALNNTRYEGAYVFPATWIFIYFMCYRPHRARAHNHSFPPASSRMAWNKPIKCITGWTHQCIVSILSRLCASRWCTHYTEWKIIIFYFCIFIAVRRLAAIGRCSVVCYRLCICQYVVSLVWMCRCHHAHCALCTQQDGSLRVRNHIDEYCTT